MIHPIINHIAINLYSIRLVLHKISPIHQNLIHRQNLYIQSFQSISRQQLQVMGTQHSHNHTHSQTHLPKNDQKCTDPAHNHQHSHNRQHKQPKPKKIFKDSIILPQYGGQVTIDKVSKVVVKKIQVYDFQLQFVQTIVKKRMCLRHPNFITVKNYSFESFADNPEFDSRTDMQKSLYFCYPESKILRLQFDPTILHVHALILQHCQKRQPMQQHEIRRIMSSVIDCLIYLKHNEAFHGDIKPSKIFINPKTQVVQLVDSYFVSNGLTSYQMVNENPSCKSFLTPQQLEKKKKKSTDSLDRVYQSEVFCVGLTLLQMMTFEESMNIYELEQLEVRKEFIERKVVEMEEYGYSKGLAGLALKCIHKEPGQRPSYEQIRSGLRGQTAGY